MNQTTDSSVKISMVHFVRTKKLKGGREVIRSIRTIHNPQSAFSVVSGKTIIDVIIDHKFGNGKLKGELNRQTGEFNMSVSDVEVKGYLKGRGFKLLGYGLSASVSNITRKAVDLNTQPRGIELKGKDYDYCRSKGPTKRW